MTVQCTQHQAVYHGVHSRVWASDVLVGINYFPISMAFLIFSKGGGMCNEGDIRLMDGIIDNEGRVEICVNQVWGSICDNAWDKTDAHVACTQLGHPELGKKIILIHTHVVNILYNYELKFQ